MVFHSVQLRLEPLAQLHLFTLEALRLARQTSNVTSRRSGSCDTTVSQRGQRRMPLSLGHCFDPTETDGQADQDRTRLHGEARWCLNEVGFGPRQANLLVNRRIAQTDAVA